MDPEEKLVAKMYQTDKDKFDRIAKNWVKDHAIDLHDLHANIFSEIFYHTMAFFKFSLD
jgi:hypothetical protein